METPFLWVLANKIQLDINVLKDYFYLVCGSGSGWSRAKISEKIPKKNPGQSSKEIFSKTSHLLVLSL